MADFVKLNEFNIVVKGITIHDNECPTEEAGVAFINNLFKIPIFMNRIFLNRFIRG